MKMTKRAICLLLAAVMALALTIPVVAAEDTGTSGGSPKEIKLNAGKEGKFDEGGTLVDGNMVYTVTVTDDALPLKLPAPKREGWEFVGWCTQEVTESFDSEVNDSGTSKPNTHYYQWTITPKKEDVVLKAGDELQTLGTIPETGVLYARYEPTLIKYHLHACGWRGYWGDLEVTRQYGVPFDQYVFPWNATLLSGDKVEEVNTWVGEDDTFTLDGWYTKDNTPVPGGIKPDGDISEAGTTVGSFGNNVDLYLHWHNSDNSVNQSMATNKYHMDRRASFVEFKKEQRNVVHVHEDSTVRLHAYTIPDEAYPVGITWTSKPDGIVKVTPVLDEYGFPTLDADVYGVPFNQTENETRTAEVTVTLKGENGVEVTRTTKVAVGHDFNSYISSWGGNCNSPGYTQWKCSIGNCTKTYTAYTDKMHKFSNPITTLPTCTTPGITVQTCSVCGIKRETDEVPATGHHFETTVQTSCGGTITTRTCIDCGAIDIEQSDGAAHNVSSEFTVDKPATCGSVGSKSRHCQNTGTDGKPCTYVEDVKEIPATGDHKWGDWTVVTKPDINNEGLDERICADCGARETRVTAKTKNSPTGSVGGGFVSGGGSSATPSPSPSASPEPSPSPSESPSPSPEPGTTPEPGVTPAPTPVPVPVDPPKTNEGSGWSYDYDTGDYYYFVEGEPKANYWAKDETASQWGFWYYVGSDGKLATGLQYIENNNGTGWYFLQPGNDDGCVGKMLTGWQWLGPEAGEGWFSTAHGGKNGQCTWTENWGNYDPATGLWEDGLSHK